MDTQEKLRDTLNKYAQTGLAVAFSGGIDSSLLLKLACDTGYPVQAVMLQSQLMPLRDREIAEQVAKECGAPLTVLEVDVSTVQEVMENDRLRCYFCKREMFRTLRRWCERQGILHIADGTNADDLTVYRPGRTALQELGIHSPLAELGITKAEVRAMAAKLELSVASRPSAPCMATRLPYGTRLDFALLRRIEAGEQLLKDLGFPICRLRLHGQVLRIEVPADRLTELTAQGPNVITELKKLGFCYITLDLEGFRSGSMDI